MKRTYLAATLIAATTLATGCGQQSQETVEDTITVETKQAESAANTPNESAPGKTGERVETSIKPNNDVYETIESITLGSTCKYPSGFADDIPEEGWQFLQIEAILEVEKLQNPDNVGQPATMLQPVAIDKDGFTQYLETAIECGQPSDGRQLWYTAVYEGEKVRVFGVFNAPVGVQNVKVGGRTFEVKSS